MASGEVRGLAQLSRSQDDTKQMVDRGTQTEVLNYQPTVAQKPREQLVFKNNKMVPVPPPVEPATHVEPPKPTEPVNLVNAPAEALPITEPPASAVPSDSATTGPPAAAAPPPAAAAAPPPAAASLGTAAAAGAADLGSGSANGAATRKGDEFDSSSVEEKKESEKMDIEKIRKQLPAFKRGLAEMQARAKAKHDRFMARNKRKKIGYKRLKGTQSAPELTYWRNKKDF